MNEKLKQILTRAGMTFVEAFLSSVVAHLALFTEALGDYAALKSVAISVGVGALATAISAAWNVIKEYGTKGQ
ncbi:MAG: hypothetical protein IKY59_07340 [Oscillospiraceae bacterium]|nr:hypothetical protein [Oscillospiraceae bacterium]